MKKGILILCSLVLFSCASSRILDKNTFTKEVIVSNLPETPDQLYIKANSWMIETFISKNNVIEFTDKEQRALIGKYLLYKTYIKGIYIDHYAKIDVRIKENSIKLQVKPVNNIETSQKNAPTEIRNKIQDIANSFKKAMNKKEDW